MWRAWRVVSQKPPSRQRYQTGRNARAGLVVDGGEVRQVGLGEEGVDLLGVIVTGLNFTTVCST